MKTRQHITAVIFDHRGRVLSVGQNSYIKTHPLQAKWASKVGCPEKVFLHAEVAAIVKCKSLHKAYRILVSRWDSKGRPMLAKPCAVCESAIRAAGITVINHT